MMKKAGIIVLICLGVLLLGYIGESIYVSSRVYVAVKDSYLTYGEGNSQSELVTDEMYQRLCYRDGYLVSTKTDSSLQETNKLLFPITIHWFVGGKTTYWYTYAVYDTAGECRGGSWNIPVTVTVAWEEGKLRITDYYEAP